MLENLYLLNAENEVTPRGDTGIAGAPGRGLTDNERRMGALELAMETLIRLGISNGTYTEQQFFDMARKIDSEDGIMDGRRDLMRMRKVCPTCGKPNSADKGVCMWCTTSLVDVEAMPTPPGATSL